MSGFSIEHLNEAHRDAFTAFMTELAPQITDIFDDSVEFSEGDHSLCLVAVNNADRSILAIVRVGGYELTESIDITCGVLDMLLDNDEDAAEALLAILPTAARLEGFRHLITATTPESAAKLGGAGWTTTADAFGFAWTGADDGGAVRVFELPVNSGHSISATVIDEPGHYLWQYTAPDDRADQQERIDTVIEGLDIMQEVIDGYAAGIEEFHIVY